MSGSKVHIGVTNSFSRGPHGKAKCVCYGSDGLLHIAEGRNNKSIKYGPSYGKGDIIGTLFNSMSKTLIFYKNRVRFVSVINLDCLKHVDQYYPKVLVDIGTEVRSVSPDVFVHGTNIPDNMKHH